MSGDVTAVIDRVEQTARYYGGDDRVHWYRSGALSGDLADPHWAFAWCRELVPYAVRHPKDELSADLSGRVCPICHNASPLCQAERVEVRQYNERPRPDERCICGLEPSWVIVVEYSDHTSARFPYCGRTPTNGPGAT